MNRHGGAKNAKYAASRLAMTEQAYFHSVSQQKAFGKLDVEEFEIVAAIDNHTSEICREMDGKVFLTRDFEPGLNANPFHPNCHCTTVPYFEDFNEGEMRFARDEDGKRYYVPSDMKYNEWKEKFVGGGEKSEIVNSLEKDVEKSLDKTAKSGIMEIGKDLSHYVGAPISERDNLHIREWYYANVHNISNIIDKNLPLEQQALQAYNLRNKFKHEARAAMMDIEILKMLEQKRPVKSFDELLNDKMKRKGLNRDEALQDILQTASKTNSEVDELFNL